MKRWILPVLFTFGCGSTEQHRDLNGLDVTTLSVTAGFDVEHSDMVMIFASMTYRRVGDDCPTLPIEAALDGTPLASSPNGTGKLGDRCQLGFYVDMPTVDAASPSTVTFRDSTGEASFAVQSLLVPHALVTGVDASSTLQPGNRILFEWSVTSDKLQSADAYFTQAPTSTKVEAKVTGTDVQVTVPELAPGSWVVRLGAVAHGNVTACTRAAACSATISGNGLLGFMIQ